SPISPPDLDVGAGRGRRAPPPRAANYSFVAPDNGVLAWTLHFLAHDGRLTLDQQAGHLLAGPRHEVVEQTERRFWRHEVSSTFHGRDIFGPVAAELSLGRPLSDLGQS